MKRIQVILAIFISFNLPLLAQTPIRWLSGIPRDNLVDIYTQDGKRIDIVAGTLFSKSSDSGKTWTSYSLNEGSSWNIKLIEMDENIKIILANNCVLKSADSGKTWSIYNLDVRAYDIAKLNQTDLIITCEDGIIYKSIDSGENWQKIQLGYSYDLAAIQKLNNNIFITAHSADYSTHANPILDSRILCSKDTGKTWFSFYHFINQYLIKTVFHDEENGIAIITDFDQFGDCTDKIMKTTDSGINWNQKYIYSDVNVYLNDVSYVDSNICFVLGTRGPLKSTDAGNNWSISNVPGNIDRIVQIDDQLIYGIGNICYESNDKGNSWIPFLNKDLGGIEIQAVDSNNIFIASGSGLLKTSDGGNNWQNNSFDILGTKISFINKNFGTIIGRNEYNNPQIINTSDGGISWKYQYANMFIYLWDVCLYDKDFGLIIGNKTDNNKEYFLRTTNGGDKWSAIPNNSQQLLSVTYADKDNWFAVGYNGVILHSTDQGVTWNEENSGTSEILEYVYFLDNNCGYITGENGTLLQTNNQGQSWQRIDLSSYDLGQYNTLTSVAFADSLNGVVVGNNSNFLITRDGGKNWELQKNLSQGFNSVSYAENYFFITGSGGSLLRIRADNPTTIPKDNIVSYKLFQNYPNPFNPSTRIDYSIPRSSFVTLKVYDILGREVATLVNEEKPAGNYEVEFNGSNLSSGVYFYRIEAESFVSTKKLVLLK